MKIKYIIVVEGANDKSFLSSFINGEIISVNGREVSPLEIDYLSQLSKLEPLIVLTDSDKSGDEIRQILESKLINVIHIKVDNLHYTSNKKHGVKETEKEYLLSLLKPYAGDVIFRSNNPSSLISDLSLSIEDENQLKTKIIDVFHLGKCNTKSLVYRLNRLGLSYNDIKRIL